MDFGRTGNLQFNPTLPEIDSRSIQICGGSPATDFKIYLGGPVWGIPEWKGNVYPLDVSPKTQMHAYAQQFNTIELNSTFYGAPPEDTVTRWIEHAPATFRFCPKVPKALSHSTRIQPEALKAYTNLLSQLKPRLGLPFLQLSPYRTPADWNFIQTLCGSLGTLARHALEFRDPAFFQEGQLKDPFRIFLEQQKLTSVITDTPGERSVLHASLTTPFLFVRFLLTLNTEIDQERLILWKKWIASAKQLGLRRVFFFMHAEPEYEIAEPLKFFAEKCATLDPELKPWIPHSLL